MPKKTKKEKIIAEYRRKLQGIRETVPTSLVQVKDAPTARQTQSPSPYVYQTITRNSYNSVTVVQPVDRAIRRDLVKTLILAAIVIGGEVVLSMMMK